MKFLRHDHIEIPPGNTIVWRYIGLEKFLDLLTHQRLFFTNAKNFTDGYEVSLPANIVASKRKELSKNGLTGRDLEEELATFEWTNRPMRDLTLVNCWSLGQDESYALWKIYLGGSRAGVAIRTNLSRLRKSFEGGNDPFPEDIYIGKVQYKNFLPEKDLSRFRLVTTKREFYEYEKELRLFILHFPKLEGGIKLPYDLSVGRYIDVDLEILIDKLYLSPFVAPWFSESMNRILGKVAPFLTQRIVASDIRDR